GRWPGPWPRGSPAPSSSTTSTTTTASCRRRRWPTTSCRRRPSCPASSSPTSRTRPTTPPAPAASARAAPSAPPPPWPGRCPTPSASTSTSSRSARRWSTGRPGVDRRVAGQARRVVGGAGMIGELVHVADDLVVAPAPHPLVAPHEAIPGEDVAGVVAAVVADRLLQVGRTGVAHAVGLDRPPVRDGEVESPGEIGGAARYSRLDPPLGGRAGPAAAGAGDQRQGCHGGERRSPGTRWEVHPLCVGLNPSALEPPPRRTSAGVAVVAAAVGLGGGVGLHRVADRAARAFRAGQAEARFLLGAVDDEGQGRRLAAEAGVAGAEAAARVGERLPAP